MVSMQLNNINQLEVRIDDLTTGEFRLLGDYLSSLGLECPIRCSGGCVYLMFDADNLAKIRNSATFGIRWFE